MINKVIRIGIALVWLINGLFCKVLNLVPRHQEIVARILGDTFSRELIVLIGVSEIIMAFWVLSKFKTKLNAILQIFIVLLMNIIEFIYASDLLLWGKFNSLFALFFVIVVYINEFKLTSK